MLNFQAPRNRRYEPRTLAGRFRGGKLAPVMIVPFLQGEGGTVRQNVTFELDPIPGRMLTEITAQVVSVFVPVLAVEALLRPDEDHSGNAEIFREKLISGKPVFPLEDETEISRRMGVVPRKINGKAQVNSCARLAHNCAVNYLRSRKYVKAQQLDRTNVGITPALISQTVLDRLNGVLDPEDRVNGAVSLEGHVPVEGIAFGTSSPTDVNYKVVETDASASPKPQTYPLTNKHDGSGVQLRLTKKGDLFVPNVVANLGRFGEKLSLSQFYTAEKMDQLTREMRRIVDKNPEYGEDIVARIAHGLNVEPGKQPFVLYEREFVLDNSMERAMDGANLGTSQSNLWGSADFTVPVPHTEFGGFMVTFAVVKPDEALSTQPHPILSDVWAGRNYIADEMAIDPVPVHIRELDADCKAAHEGTVALYVGNNELLRRYSHYGFNRFVDPKTVASKSAIWQLDVPMSVTPQSVIYPENLSHYPFSDQNAEVCQYTCSSVATIQTPIIFGPTPVEELAAIEAKDVFDEKKD